MGVMGVIGVFWGGDLFPSTEYVSGMVYGVDRIAPYRFLVPFCSRSFFPLCVIATRG